MWNLKHKDKVFSLPREACIRVGFIHTWGKDANKNA